MITSGTLRKHFERVFYIALFIGAGVMVIGGSYAGGLGTTQNPYQVATADQLNNIRNDLDAHFVQTADIDLAAYSAGEGWEPIGEWPDGFTGSFDGNDNIITGLFIDRPQSDFEVGLFGYIQEPEEEEPAELTGIVLENVDVTGRNGVGALVGSNDGGELINCRATGDVSGEMLVGLLVGSNNGSITGSSAEGTASGDDYVGGLSGTNEGPIIDSYADAVVQGNNEMTGGLVGWSIGPITGSYALGSVSGDLHVGGLTGANSDKIEESYSLAAVSGGDNAGGLSGVNAQAAEIIYSFAAGAVSGQNDTGGLVGYNDDGTIADSYYDEDESGQSDVGKGIPLSTSQMKQQTSFTGWNFQDIWDMSDPATAFEGYPVLQWQEVPTEIRDWFVY